MFGILAANESDVTPGWPPLLAAASRIRRSSGNRRPAVRHSTTEAKPRRDRGYLTPSTTTGTPSSLSQRRTPSPSRSAKGDDAGTMTTWPEPVERVAAYLWAPRQARIEEVRDSDPDRRGRRPSRGVWARADREVARVRLRRQGDPARLGRQAREHPQAARRGWLPETADHGRRVRRAGDGVRAGRRRAVPAHSRCPACHGRSLMLHETVWVGPAPQPSSRALAPSELVRLARADPVDAVG